jgi:hypothetical protein
MAAKSIGLSEVIEMVRSELDDAIKKGEGEKVRFRSQKVTLELEMGTSRSADGSGGVRLWVLDLGATGRDRAASWSSRDNRARAGFRQRAPRGIGAWGRSRRFGSKPFSGRGRLARLSPR